MTDTEKLYQFVSEQKDAAFTIKSVASEINMISINAAIESAHATSGIRSMIENVLDRMMISICRMLTKVLEAGSLSMDTSSMTEFARWVGVDDIFITDGDGVTIGSNSADAAGWRFPDDPKAQAFVFRSLIGQNDGVVTQPIRPRDLDSTMYKFVGVSRTDEPGIVQIGLKAESITRYQTEIGSVFGILATEIKNLGTRVVGVSKGLMDNSTELEKYLDNHNN